MIHSIADLSRLPADFSMRLILIRHGEPEPGVKGRCYGSLDVSLSEAGRMQIQAKFASISLPRGDAVYASPLKRAMETATMVAAGLQVAPKASDDLREIDFGSFEGLTYEAIEKLYPEEYRSWMERPTEIEFPQGESFARLKKRVLGFKQSLMRDHHGKTVYLVSHGSVNRILVAEVLAVPDSMIFRLDQSYAAVNIVDYFQEYAVVRLVNG